MSPRDESLDVFVGGLIHSVDRPEDADRSLLLETRTFDLPPATYPAPLALDDFP